MRFPSYLKLRKNLPATQETRVLSLGWEDPLEKEMATHSSILAWRIPWTEEPGGLQSVGLQRVRHNQATNTNFTAYLMNEMIWKFLIQVISEKKSQSGFLISKHVLIEHFPV